MLTTTPAVAAALAFLGILPYFAPRHQTPWRPYDRLVTTAAAARCPATVFFHLYDMAYARAEDILIDELERFPRKHGNSIEFEEILSGLVNIGSRRGLRPMIHHLPTHFVRTIPPRGRTRLDYPAERAILYIGEPAFQPLIDEFIRTADDAKLEDVHTCINGVFADAKWTARALEEAKRRLFAKPDDKKNVQACKKLIRHLMAYDPNHEIDKFTDSFPPPWWDKFKE